MRLPNPENTYALLIGTSEYASDDLPDVPHVANNLAALREVLTSPEHGGLLADHCTLLPNPADGQTVMNQLRGHAAQATDTLLIYYAGHGMSGEHGELFLGLPRTDPQDLEVSALPIRPIRNLLAYQTPARNRVLILDCCYSGRLTEFGHQGAGDDAIMARIDIEGTYALAAAPGSDYALYAHGDAHTAFTGMLLTLLRNGVADAPDLLTFNQIYRQLYLTALRRDLPLPQQRNDGTIADLALTRNPAHTRQPGETPAISPPSPSVPAEPPVLPQPHADLDEVHSATRVAQAATSHLLRSDLHRPDLLRIGLWGPSASGKTTFVAALNVAAAQSQSGWRIVGTDDKAVAFLTDMTAMLTNYRQFPQATINPEILSLSLMGELELRFRSRWRMPRTTRVPRRAHLEILEIPNGLFEESTGRGPVDLDLDDMSGHAPSGSELLADCDGIVLFYDAVREHEHGDNFKHFHQALAQLNYKLHRHGHAERLPHPLAVCITKLDDPRIYRTALDRGYLTSDPDNAAGFPTVTPDDAERLFDDLAAISPTGTASLINQMIRDSFHPDRVRFYATSSIGFHHKAGSTRIDETDAQNIVHEPEGGDLIRGGIHPINVLEPLVWLTTQLATAPHR